MAVEVQITVQHAVLVDEEDAGIVRSRRWHVIQNKHTLYVRTTIDGKTVYLHRLIMGAATGFQVDHRNGNGLDNRRENLRVVTNVQNCQNRAKRKGQSAYKGVFPKPSGSWDAAIRVNGQRIRLGTYQDESDAARAYDMAATEVFGEFARLNFPERA